MSRCTPEDVAELRRLIDDEINNQEVACQAFLPKASDLLCTEIPRTVTAVTREDVTSVGRPDLLLISVVGDGAADRLIGYVWEVKAPQCFVFTYDNHARRLRPSAELAKAESQLINYVEAITNDATMRQYYGLAGLHATIRPGGIIIGSRRTMVSGLRSGNDGDVRAAYDQAHYVRRKYFYEHNGIRLKTWEWILDYLQPLGGAP